MPAVTSRPPVRAALVGLTAALLVSFAAGAAQAEPGVGLDPSPSASPTESGALAPTDTTDPAADPAATPGATPSPSASATPTPALPSQIIDDSSDTGLAVGVGRYIPYPSTATAVGGNGIATATLPLPPGLVPVVLNGTLTSIADSNGTVRIRVGTERIEMDATKGGDFTIPVPFDAIVDNTVTVEVRNTLEPGVGECEGDFTTTETISNLVLGFIGKETPPTTIAGFFSPPVQKVTLISPDDPTIEMAEATLSAAGAIATRYDRQVPIVTISESAFQSDPNARIDVDGPKRLVRLLPTDADKVTVTITNPGVPTLTIEGPSPELAEAASALASPSLGLAGAPVATELSEKRSGIAEETLTLADLGQPKPSLAGIGRLVYSLPLAQDRFGGPVNSVTIHLEGAHTPVAPGGQTTASILWNDQLIESQQLANDDVYSVDVTVDGSLVRRDNFLSLRLDVTPPGGDCGNAVQPMQLDVNGYNSTISATPGQSLPAGFARFPQVFGNELNVAFGSGPLTNSLLNAACSMVISLQRAASTQFEVNTQDFASFVTAQYPGMVIGATPEDADTLKAPLRYEPWRAVNSSFTEFTVTVDGPFAALEAFEYDGRNILMLGSTAPAEQSAVLVNTLADEAMDGEFGWFGLRDSILVAQSQAPLLYLNTSVLVPQDSVTSEGRKLPPWWILVIGAIIVLLLLRWWMLRRRKKRIARRVAEADAASAAESAGQSDAVDAAGGAAQEQAPDVT